MSDKHKSKSQPSVYEPENLFILKLPEEIASELNDKFDQKQIDDLKDIMFLDLDVERRKGKFRWKDQLLYTKLYNLPCIIECLKTLDKKTYYKTGDISQFLVCKPDLSDKEDESYSLIKNKKDKEKRYNWNHGITPPLKNVRKRRFRKIIKKKTLDLPQIEKEVRRLLKADNEAVDVKWEVVYEDAQGDAKPRPSISLEPARGKETKNSVSDVSGIKIEEGEQSLSAMEDLLLGDMSETQIKEKLKLAETDIFGESLSSSSQGDSDEEDKGDGVFKDITQNESVNKQSLKESTLFEDYGNEDDEEEEDQVLGDLEEKGWDAPDEAEFSKHNKFGSGDEVESHLVPKMEAKIEEDDSLDQENGRPDGAAPSTSEYITTKDAMSRKDEIKAELSLLRQKRATHQFDLEGIENSALRLRFQNILNQLAQEETLLLSELEILDVGP